MLDQAPDGPSNFVQHGARTDAGVDSAPSADDTAGPAPTDLEEELLAYGRHIRGRDDLIRRAKAGGFSELRIAKLMGHSRSTVRSVLGER